MNDGLEEKDLSKTTIEEYDGRLKRLGLYGIEEEALEKKLGELKVKINEEKDALFAICEYFQKSSLESDFGSFEIRRKTSWRTPKTPEDKKALFEYFKEKGVFWEYLNVNSNSLNSFCNQELAIAKEENRECKIPGLDSPTDYNQLIFKRKK